MLSCDSTALDDPNKQDIKIIWTANIMANAVVGYGDSFGTLYFCDTFFLTCSVLQLHVHTPSWTLILIVLLCPPICFEALHSCTTEGDSSCLLLSWVAVKFVKIRRVTRFYKYRSFKRTLWHLNAWYFEPIYYHDKFVVLTWEKATSVK